MTISDLIQRMHPTTLGRILEDLSEAADKATPWHCICTNASPICWHKERNNESHTDAAAAYRPPVRK